MSFAPPRADVHSGTSDSPGLTGILLAAGSATRFRGPKCLARLDNGVAMAVQAARNLEPAVDRLVCVVRVDDRALQSEIIAAGFEWVECCDAKKGMSASLRAGLDASRHSAGWLVALADMPWIDPATCRAVARELHDHKDIVVPVYDGKRGHPVGFPASRLGDLVALTGDGGARSLLEEHSLSVRRVPLKDPGILRDVDTPDQLKCVS